MNGLILTRLPDWERRLHDYLARSDGAVFGYDHAIEPAHLDCCAFSAGAVLAMTGDDPMAEFRGHYTTRIGSLRALRRHGQGTIADTLDAKFSDVDRAFARRGDLVLVDGMVGVCVGAEAVFIGAENGVDGYVRYPRTSWTRCWIVG